MRRFRKLTPVALLVLGLGGCSKTTEKTIIREVPAEDTTTPPPPVDPCTVKVNSVQPALGFAPTSPLTAGATYKYNHDGNTATPDVEFQVEYVQKKAITVDGLQFRDLNGNGTLELYEDWRYSDVCRAKDLVARMTVPQKVGLMSESSSIGTGTADGSIPTTTVGSIAYDNRRQALMRMASFNATQLATYVNNLQAVCEGLPLGIPFVVTADPIHGFGMSTNATTGVQTLNPSVTVSPWPYPLGLGAANDVALTRQYGDTVRKEFRAMGFRWQLGPMADLGTEPRWARVQNVFGENAFHVSKHVKACIEGFQGTGDGGLRNGIAATMKHFPGAGPDEDGKDSHRSTGKWNVFPGDNFEYHQISFRAAIAAGAAAVMPCYSIFKGQTDYSPEQTGAAFSKGLVTNYLKEQLGFDGMVTGDWGTVAGGSPHGVEALTRPERAAMFVQAGSNQLGSDSHLYVQQAYDQGLLSDADIDGAATKILEMTFKLGLFENPYTDTATSATIARSEENLQNGFDAQKKAIVLLRNNGAARLPISQTRYTDVAGGTAGAPDVGEFGSDANGDGKIAVFFDGVVDGLHGTAGAGATDSDPYTFLGDFDYAAEGAGQSGVTGFALPIVQAATPADADIAVLRITARKGTYFGLDAGVPLSFDAPFPGLQTDTGYPAAVKDAQKVIDLFRVRDGYTKADGTVVAAANPKLKIVLVMHMDRPSIVKPFINGLKTLDESPGVPGSYPLVSNEANVNQTIVTASTATAKAGVDVFLVDFGAFDRAILDFVFAKNVPAGWAYGQARLPMEIPSTDAEVEAQYEDLPADTWNPTFALGAGTDLPAN